MITSCVQNAEFLNVKSVDTLKLPSGFMRYDRI